MVARISSNWIAKACGIPIGDQIPYIQQPNKNGIQTVSTPDDFPEYSLHRLRIGVVYDLATCLAELLILSGYANPEESVVTVTAKRY